MIDLSYLTEEEQEMIMTVLKRDVELKKANEERIKQLQKLDSETQKYMTGEWFYEAKSQRHQDRIHGSDIIMASMRQRKPMTVDLLSQSWRDRPSRSNNVMTPKPELSGSCSLEEDQQDRLNRRSASRPRHNPFNSEPMDLDHEKMDSPLTNETTRPGADEASSREMLPPLKSDEAVNMETKSKDSDTVHREKPIPKRRTKMHKLQSTMSDSTSSVSSQSVYTSSDNRSTMSPESTQSMFAYSDNTSTMSPESTPSMSACSDNTSTMSTPSVSVSSGIRSPPPRGILKHNSSCNSSGSNVKSQLPLPLKRLGLVPATGGPEQGLGKHTITEERTEESLLSSTDQEPLQSSSPLRSGLPKSRLPVRSALPLSNPVQTAQEKPIVIPQQSSGTRSDDDHKPTDLTHTAKPKYKNNNLNWSSTAEPANQENCDETMKEPLKIPRANAGSAPEAHLDTESSETSVLQASLPKLERAGQKMSEKESKKAQEQGDSSQSTVDQHGHKAINTTDVSDQASASHMAGPSHTADASLEYTSSFSPPAVRIKRKAGETRVKTENYQHPVMVHPQSPQPTEEQGASIAKVLEWFTRSSESSEKLDHEESVQDMDDDVKMEDIDFESETELRTKRADNIYLIIPRQSDENTSKVDDVFLKDWEKELDIEQPEPVGKTQDVGEQGCDLESESMGQLPVVMVTSAAHSSFEPKNGTHRKMDISEKAEPTEKVVEIIANKEDNSSNVKLDGTEGKVIGNQQKESMTLEEDQPPKMTDLLSFWERGNTSPTTLISRSGINNEKDNTPVKYKVGRDVLNYGEETPKSERTTKVKSSAAETKKQVKSVKEVLNEGKSRDVSQESINKYGNVIKDDNVKDMQPPWSHAEQKKDVMVSTSSSGTDAASRVQKTRSASLDSEGGQNRECVMVSTNTNCSEGDHRLPAKLNFGHRTNSEEIESEAELRSPGATGGQEQDSRSEKIKRLRSFWEKEKWQHRIYGKSTAADDIKSSVASPTKLNKRLSKSEFDLRSVGTELDDEHDDSMPVTNFVVFPLRDRTEESVTAEGINRLQFKTLREFWTGSSKQSSNFGSKIERPLIPKVKYAKADNHQEASEQCPVDSKLCLYQNLHTNQPDKINLGGFGNESGNTKSAKTGNSLQRAISMFEVNVDNEDQGQDLHWQSTKVPETNLPHIRKTTEAGVSPSRKMAEADLQLKKFPVSSRSKEKINSHTSSDTNSQRLDRSFVAEDNQQYLEITENSVTSASPQETGQSEKVCTPFQTCAETGCSQKCSTGQVCTPFCTEEPCSLELCPSTHTNEHLGHEALNDADAWTHSQAHSGRDKGSLVQDALRRAVARPVYHKSLENLSAVTTQLRKKSQPRKSNQVDDSQLHSYNDYSFPSPPSSSFSNSEHLKKLSKSVPSFLQEADGGGSDCSSEGSSLSSAHWRNGRPSSINSGMASMSSVSGSVMSVCSFTGVEVQGSIQFSIRYVEKLKELHIFVVQCQNLATANPRRNRTDPYVKSYLVPDSANLGKRKTSVKKRTLNPTYREILRYRVQMEYLRTQVLNLSVWHNDAFGHNCFLGETEVDLSTWDFENINITSGFLKARHFPSQTLSAVQSADNRGQMRLAVRFLPEVSHAKTVPNSGEVHIWIKDCKNLPLVKGATIDPYVKCVVLPDTSKKGHQKTRVLKRTANPVFNHTMVYDGFGEEDLKEACVELTVWHRDRLASRLIGGLRLSLGTGISYGVNVIWMDSDAEEVALWARMMDSPGDWVEDMLPLRMVTMAKITGK